MSLIHKIDHLARAPGVVAVLVDGVALLPEAFRGEPLWREACRLAILMRDEFGVDELSVTTNRHTIVVQRELDNQTAAVVVETGHEIRKSLRRMIRRCARAEGRKSDRAAKVDAVINPGPTTEDAEALDAAAAFET